MTQAVWRLILNGKSSGDEAVREAVMALREGGQALQVRVTWEAGDAERLVHEAIADRVAVIIAGGGDGTLSEVAEAMAMSGKDADALPALALLPLGTANDFAAATGIAIEPEAALRLIAAYPRNRSTCCACVATGLSTGASTWPAAASVPRSRWKRRKA